MNLPPARQALSRHNLHARVTIFPPRDIMFSRHLKLFPPSQTFPAISNTHRCWNTDYKNQGIKNLPECVLH